MKVSSLLRVNAPNKSGVSIGLDEKDKDALWNKETGAIDGFWSRLIKMIPMEALALYPVGKSLTPSEWWSVWSLFCLGIIIVTRILLTRDKKGKPQVGNIIISIISFVLWVYLNGDWILNWKLDESLRFFVVWIFLAWIPISASFYKGDVSGTGS